MSGDEPAVGYEQITPQTLELAGAPAHVFSDPTGSELLDRITRVAAALFDVPMAAVTVIAPDGHAVRSGMGLPNDAPLAPSSLHIATLADQGTLVIADAAEDARFEHDPWVTGRSSVRFYAGHPLHSEDGELIGTLSILDAQPRRVSSEQLARLEDLALWTQEELGRAARTEALDYMRRSRSWLRTIMDSINEAVVSFNDTGTIDYANAAAEATFGTEPDGLLHQSIVTLIDGIDWDWAAVRVRIVAHDKTVIGQRLELLGRRRDGELFPLEVVITEACVNGETVFVAIGGDLTERHRAEAALRESDNRFRTIFEGAGTGIAVTALDGRLLDVNPTFAEMLGYSIEELLELDPSRLIDDSRSRAEYGPLLKSLISARRNRYRREVQLRRRDGSELWVAATVSAVPGPEDGSVLGLVMVSDISRRKEIERFKDEFVSVVGHELRTPLTSIRGSLGLIAAGVVGAISDEASDMIVVALSNTDRLVRLINDTLDTERMEAGRSELELSAVAGASLVAQALTVVQATADAAEITVSCELADVDVWADADRIVQTLVNLLGNAIKFSPRGGEIQVAVSDDDEVADFVVCDHGRGIPPDQLETVFERFRQVDGSDAREKGGTGLGLAIARGIVEQHGGRIWAESGDGDGVGTTFHFTLPLAGHQTTLGPDDVLVVEDDVQTATALREALQGRYGTTRVARSAEEAIAAIRQSPPRIIVLDLVLPGADGIAVIDDIRDDPDLAATPIIIYSAVELDSDERELAQLGHTEFLSKVDSSPQRVARRIGQLLGGPVSHP
jgi:PAS domain S-box-containing protein